MNETAPSARRRQHRQTPLAWRSMPKRCHSAPPDVWLDLTFDCWLFIASLLDAQQVFPLMLTCSKLLKVLSTEELWAQFERALRSRAVVRSSLAWAELSPCARYHRMLKSRICMIQTEDIYETTHLTMNKDHTCCRTHENGHVFLSVALPQVVPGEELRFRVSIPEHRHFAHTLELARWGRDVEPRSTTLDMGAPGELAPALPTQTWTVDDGSDDGPQAGEYEIKLRGIGATRLSPRLSISRGSSSRVNRAVEYTIRRVDGMPFDFESGVMGPWGAGHVDPVTKVASLTLPHPSPGSGGRVSLEVYLFARDSVVQLQPCVA